MSGLPFRIEQFNRQCDFTVWLKKFEMLMNISKIAADERVDYLLTNLDISIFESVTSSLRTTNNYKNVVAFLEKRYSTNDKYLNRLEFFEAGFSGTFDEFASKIEILFENFEGNKLREQVLIAKFMCSVPKAVSSELRIRRPETLSDCVKICNSTQASQTSLCTAAISSSNQSTGNKNQLQPKNFKNRPKLNSDNIVSGRKCYRCGSNEHLASDTRCPARNATCNFCKKIGHYSSVCSVKKKGPTSSGSRQSSGSRSFTINMNSCDFNSCNEISGLRTVNKPYIEVSIEGDNQVFKKSFLVDTGSDVNILPLSWYNEYFCRSLSGFDNVILRNYDKSEIQIAGVLQNLSLSFQNRTATCDFLVCDSDTAILGTSCISSLELTVTGRCDEVVTYSIDRIENNSTTCTCRTGRVTEKPVQLPNSSSLPKLSGFQFFIKLKPNAPTSIIQKPRRVPFALEAAIEEEIAKELRDDIIEEIDSSPYLSPIVVVPKPDNKIRMCVDYKKINEHIQIDQHPLPTADEVFARLHGAKYFTKLDLRAAYHQLEIREDSRDLTAFTCHIGQFRYKRLPFGLANAPSAYMKVIHHVLKDCKNTVSYLDDILIFANDLEEHDRCLRATLQRLQEHNFTLNDQKCQYRKTEIEFLGRKLSSEGISPPNKSLEAILSAPVPHDKKTLRSFMGLLSFFRNFIPNIARSSSSLYDLLKDNVSYQWTDIHQKEFEELKLKLANCVPLTYFDPCASTSTFLTTDASGYGIAAVLTQVSQEDGKEKPVCFISRKLSEAEQKYSVSEKEFLAVLWSCERLHQYLYGRPFTIKTDHQCLKQLLKNGFQGGNAPCRVIRWSTRLLQYNFEVMYIPGRQNVIADALSRLPRDNPDSCLDLFDIHVSLNSNTLSPITIHELREETSKDDKLEELAKLINEGWPARMNLISDPMRAFWNLRHELSIIDGVIYRGEKFVIPGSLQNRIITFAHEGHLGISKTKIRIREQFWWPNLNSSVESQLRSCGCCREAYRDSPVQVPDYKHIPWHQLAIDIKGPVYDLSHRPLYIIVLIDVYTKLAMARACSTVPTNKITDFLSNVFATFGHCTIITSDNGPQFTSSDFTTFLQRRGIIHRRSAIYNPQSNGVVERMNKNLSKLLDYSEIQNISQLQGVLDRYLLSYNSTIHATTEKSPSEMVFKYDIRTNLCVISDIPFPETEVGQKIVAKSKRNASYANARRKPALNRTYKIGDLIMTKQRRQAKITGKVGPFTYKLDNGYCINARNIHYKIQNNRDEDETHIIQIPQTSDNDSSQLSDLSDSNILITSPNMRSRSGRHRKGPPYLINDYVV